MSAGELHAVAGTGEEWVFELPGSGRALFTARAAGNLSRGMGDGHEHGLTRRGELCERLGLRWLCSCTQVHGTAVNVIDEIPLRGRCAGTGGTPVAVEADAHASAMRDVGAMILVADCLPVALGCSGAVATAHAGWRGLAAGVLEEGVRAVGELGDGEIVAVVGPGAGVCCYEAGSEVHDAFGGAHRVGRNLDLRAIAHERLLAAGVGRVHDVNLCTICDERFFSHRREGARAGRQAGIAWLS